ncbi:MAG: dihydrofolate reductase [Bacteroidales bacterium]|nr:dihydrofolate reductase [Bacteroidales bacterium]
MTENKNLSLIVAVADNWAIGKDNSLLWHISDDLKRFKALTTGHCIIMGRKTYESFPKRPLPNRRNIVITHGDGSGLEGCEVVHSVQEALEQCESDEQPFIIGGATVYRQFLPFVDKIFLTKVFATFEADTFFPEIDLSQFEQTAASEVFTDEKSGLRYQFLEYRRIDQ